MNVKSASIIDEHGSQWMGDLHNMQPAGRMQTKGAHPPGYGDSGPWSCIYAFRKHRVCHCVKFFAVVHPKYSLSILSLKTEPIRTFAK